MGSLAGPGKNRLENSLIGGVAGGLLGYAMGNEAEKQGRVVINQTLETAPSRTTTTWVNPETNITYLVTPQPAVQTQGRICREVNIQASIDGKQETLSGLSCRDEYGQWRLTDRNTVAATEPTIVVTRPVTQYVVTEPAPYYYPYPYPAYAYPGYRPYYGYRGRHHHHGWRHRH
ncbi:MAG: hypothetical protein H7835_17330 [Magnetococcus sp. XQGC-1]